MSKDNQNFFFPAHKHKKSAVLYVWIFILIYLMLSETKLLQDLSNYNGIVTFFSILVCTFIEFLGKYKYSKTEILFICFDVVLFLQSIFLTDISILATIFFYLFILRKTEKKIFVRTTLHTMLTLVLVIAVLSVLNIIPDTYVRLNGRELRRSFGFLWPSRLQTYLMVIILLWINGGYKRSTHIKGLILLDILAIYFYKITDTNYPFYLSIAVSALSIVWVLINKHIKNADLLAYLFVVISPLIPFLLSVIYSTSSQWLVKLNNLLTGRLYYSFLAIKNRPLHFFNYESILRQSAETSSKYGYFDSGYLNLLYNYGIYLYIAVDLIMILAVSKAIKKKDSQIIITIVFIIMYSLWYGQILTLLHYSAPVLLCTYWIPWKHVNRNDLAYPKDIIVPYRKRW